MFIEDLFSTYLNTPTTSNTAYSINNGIDLSGGGGMVWFKSRSSAANHYVYDTARGSSSGNANTVFTNSSAAQQTANYDYLTFGSSGFTVNYATGGGQLTNNGLNYVSWTFREQPKFFDVVTWTGDGTTSRVIPHNLGVTPGCIISKITSTTGDWRVVTPAVNSQVEPNKALYLNATLAEFDSYIWSAFSSTSITISSSSANQANASGATYVAYLFASNAGGFPVSGGGSTNGISCGSFTTDGSGNYSVTLGYEPQWVLWKRTDATGNWQMYDNMRGMGVQGTSFVLYPDVSNAEAGPNNNTAINSTGFSGTNVASGTFIYIAIRRGPMKTPTVGTSVYENTAYTGNGASNRLIGSSVLTDLLLLSNRDATVASWSSYAQFVFDRLRGQNVTLATSNTNAETSGWDNYCNFDMNTGWDTGSTADQQYLNKTSSTYVSNALRRAPGFFDVVCYTGNGILGATQTHNLGVVPELMVFKTRVGSENWIVYTAPTGNAGALYLSSTAALETAGGPGYFNNTTPTATQFTVGNYTSTNPSGGTMVAYLFATLSGISKVGSYTGTGALLTVACGFTSGARFVMIKRTDSTGGWFFWDSARGITVSDDPYLLFNSSAAEVTGTNYVDTDTTGFKVTAAAPAALNASGGNYIFLAIA
jgi:hypothetical protein